MRFNPVIGYTLQPRLFSAGVRSAREAIEQYREALRLDRDCAEAHYNLGESLQDLGRLKEAEQEYREAIRLDPEDPEAMARLNDLLREMGKDV